MENNTFVMRTRVFGPNMKDCHETCHYLQEKEGTLCVKDTGTLIVNDILSLFNDPSEADESKIRRVVTSSKPIWPYETTDTGTDGKTVTVEVSRNEDKNGDAYIRVDYDTESQAENKTYYEIAEIPKYRTVYLAVEEFFPDLRGVSCVSRFYHGVFNSYRNAKNYRDKMKLHINDIRDFSPPVAEVQVFDREELEKNRWYIKNRRVIDAMAENGVDEHDETFSMFCEAHFAALTGREAYDIRTGTWRTDLWGEPESPR